MITAARLDNDTVRAAVDGSRRDLDRIVQTLQPQVRMMIAARLSPTPAQYHCAEDIAQQVQLALAQGIPRLQHRTVTGLKAYVSGIVRRRVAETLRRRRRAGANGARIRSLDSNVGQGSLAGPLWQFISASVTSPRSAFDRAEQVERLMVELGGLTPSHRRVLTLAFFDQLPTAEIAGQLHLSQRAASMLLLRAVRDLRRRMTTGIPLEPRHGTRCPA